MCLGLAVLFAASLAAGCATYKRGVVSRGNDSPLITIGAGTGAEGAPVWYMVDPRTRTCWMLIGHAAALLSCCALRRVPEAATHITWENESTCARGSAERAGLHRTERGR